MYIILSPAKSLNFSRTIPDFDYTIPRFANRAEYLVDILKSCSSDKLASLMSISPKLADLNATRFSEWRSNHTRDNSKPAAFVFDGDVYDGLRFSDFDLNDILYASSRLRILSGLYGILCPTDLIQAYRLEMGTRLESDFGKNLYEFWGTSISESLDGEKEFDTIVNLASNEYFKAIQLKYISKKVISPEFKEEKNGGFQIVSFYAKKARGLMTRFIIENKIDNPNDLKAFDSAGYAFNPRLSKDNSPVFTR